VPISSRTDYFVSGSQMKPADGLTDGLEGLPA
jgi:hypothetical protein